MAIPLKLDTFSADTSDASTVFLPKGRLDQLKINTFQVGYDQGFSAAKSQFETASALQALDLSQKLQEVVFTHIEARRNIIKALEPVLIRLVDIVMPELANLALCDIVTAQISNIASGGLIGDIVVSASIADAPILAGFLKTLRDRNFGVTVIENPSFADGQVAITAPDIETHINLDQAIDATRQGLIEYFHLVSQEKSNG
jgi:hypothetical protein